VKINQDCHKLVCFVKKSVIINGASMHNRYWIFFIYNEVVDKMNVFRFFNFPLWRDLCRLDIYHYTQKFWGDKTSAFLNFIVSSEKVLCIFTGLGIMLFFSWLGSGLELRLRLGLGLRLGLSWLSMHIHSTQRSLKGHY